MQRRFFKASAPELYKKAGPKSCSFCRMNLSLMGCSPAEPVSVSIHQGKIQYEKLYLQLVKKGSHLQFRGITSSVEGQKKNAINFKVFPIPARDMLNIEISSESISRNSTIHIYDGLGRIILESKITEQVKELDISSLESGFYLISLQNEKGYAYKKFVKE